MIFSNECAQGTINVISNNDIIVSGTFNDICDNNIVYFIAASPPDYRSSFYGSGLPYFNEKQAYYNTPNKLKYILDKDMKFTFKMSMPNSYYTNLGNMLITPHIRILYNQAYTPKTQFIHLNNGLQYRTLTYSDNRSIIRKSPLFYTSDTSVKTQEEIFQDSVFPSDTYTMKKNFWGKKPPQ